MPEIAGGIVPLNWPALVTEALRRRRAEKMTQKEHAALAHVSIPTMIAFDRAELTLSLAKARDILSVVGLVEVIPEGSLQDQFVGTAVARWQALTTSLPKNAPERFPRGCFRIDYELVGDIRKINVTAFAELLEKSIVRHTGWPLFRVPKNPDRAAYEYDGGIECWLHADEKNSPHRVLHDPAHCDFWRASPSGRAMIMRGYQEDSQETFPPGTIFDTTLPIWRIGEAFLHAARFGHALARDPLATTVRLRALYTGLQGRDLRAWANPLGADHFVSGRSRSDEVMLDATIPLFQVEDSLADPVFAMISRLFERFGVTGLSHEFVASELHRMRQNRFGEDRADRA